MLSDAIEYRRTHVGMYTSHRPVHRLYQTEFIPWTGKGYTVVIMFTLSPSLSSFSFSLSLACEEMLDLLRRLVSVFLYYFYIICFLIALCNVGSLGRLRWSANQWYRSGILLVSLLWSGINTVHRINWSLWFNQVMNEYMYG